jgi:hypothetical protein
MRGETTGDPASLNGEEWRTLNERLRCGLSSKLLSRIRGTPFDICQNMRCWNHLWNVVENMHLPLREVKS